MVYMLNHTDNESGCPTNNLILTPANKLRGKPNAVLKGCRVEASVHLGDSRWNNTEYSHPCVTLYKVGSWVEGIKSEEYSDTLLSIVFQRNKMGTSEYDKPCSSMFKGIYNHAWGGCYAGKVQGDFDQPTRMSVGLGLLERARDAIKSNDDVRREVYRRSRGCDLYTLVFGLLRIGIPVIIRDARFTREPFYSLT